MCRYPALSAVAQDLTHVSTGDRYTPKPRAGILTEELGRGRVDWRVNEDMVKLRGLGLKRDEDVRVVCIGRVALLNNLNYLDELEMLVAVIDIQAQKSYKQ